MPDYVSRKKVSIAPFKDGNRAWQGKQNQEKKKRSCTRGLPVAACQRYLCFDWRTFPTSSRFSFGVLSVVRIARARAHSCLSCDVYRLVGDNHRRERALTEPITSIEAATVRQIIGIYFLGYLLSLSSSDFRFSDRWPSIPGIYYVSLGCWYKLPYLVWKRRNCF